MDDKSLYSQILGITHPWLVTCVDLVRAESKVIVSVACGEDHACHCPECGKECRVYDRKPREWRHLDTCQFMTIIQADVPRTECPEHGVHMVGVPWAEAGRRYTVQFETMVLMWLKDAAPSAVAEHFRLGWDAVTGIRDKGVRRGLARRESVSALRLGIDETSSRKGHNYLTVVSDGKRVLHVAEGRDKAAIDGFWPLLDRVNLGCLESVSMDLWKAYQSSVMEHVPDAAEKICLDRFHVAGYFSKALDLVRRREHKELTAQGDASLKGTKWDWLRSDAKCDNRGRKWFTELKQGATRTARAWAMKETAATLWSYDYMGVAEKQWKRLIGWMQRSRLQPMVDLAKSIRKNLWMILNAIRIRANNGNAESINSRIQKIKSQACGFRNMDNFKNAIYFHLGELRMFPDGGLT